MAGKNSTVIVFHVGGGGGVVPCIPGILFISVDIS
jgi:hypothetical protein